MGQEATYVGIDVAKAQVDVAVRPTDDSWGVPHDQKGVRKLVSQMKALKPAMVLLEASGGLELSLVAALAAAALPVVVVNPRQVRDFARATGKLAKTDSLDAAVLTHFAEAVRPPVRPLRDAETQALNSLAARRHQVMTMLVSEKNRLSAATVAASRLTSRGWNRSWTTWTRVCGRPSIRVPCGERRTTSCAPSPEWESRSPSPSWPTCRSWAPWTAGRSPPWWGWAPYNRDSTWLLSAVSHASSPAGLTSTTPRSGIWPVQGFPFCTCRLV